jgi:hypothetical protein
MTIRNPISRRDFLDGVALTVVSAALPPLAYPKTNNPLSGVTTLQNALE